MWEYLLLSEMFQKFSPNLFIDSTWIVFTHDVWFAGSDLKLMVNPSLRNDLVRGGDGPRYIRLNSTGGLTLSMLPGPVVERSSHERASGRCVIGWSICPAS